MLGFIKWLLGPVFAGTKLRDASLNVLKQRCGIYLGPMGQALLEEHASKVTRLAGNRQDVCALTLADMVEAPGTYGLDDKTSLSMARWACRLAEDGALPDTLGKAKKAQKTVMNRTNPSLKEFWPT